MSGRFYSNIEPLCGDDCSQVVIKFVFHQKYTIVNTGATVTNLITVVGASLSLINLSIYFIQYFLSNSYKNYVGTGEETN